MKVRGYCLTTHMHHSCIPTCTMLGHIGQNLVAFEAKAGEEVTTSYLPEGLPFEARTEKLSTKYNVTCHCELCRRERVREQRLSNKKSVVGLMYHI